MSALRNKGLLNKYYSKLKEQQKKIPTTNEKIWKYNEKQYFDIKLYPKLINVKSTENIEDCCKSTILINRPKEQSKTSFQ